MKSNLYLVKIVMLLICLFMTMTAFNQVPAPNFKSMTKVEILNMSYEQLLNLPFEDLINLANIMGVSADELLQMILNKDVSSASKSKEKVLQSPLSTTVISKEELDKSGATSIVEALRLVPGMIVREKTPGNFDVHIRGNDNIPSKNMFVYSEDAISLVMIDNRPVYNYAFGGTFWETLPVDINDVERIEVIRGAVSALYGPNAVAGVINIITKHPDNKKLAVNTNIQHGTQNSTLANIGLSGGLNDKFKFRVSGNYQHRERFQNDFYVFDLNKYVSYDQMDTLTNYWSTSQNQKTEPAELNFKDRIISKNLATDKYAANAFLYYDIDKNINFAFTTGLQRSEIVSTTLGNHTIPYVGRQSHTQYFDFKSKIYGFDFQTNYMFGNQQTERGEPAWHISPHIFNSQLEYEYKLGTLTVRPGVSYQKTMYTDKDYVNKEVNPTYTEGFLNGDKVLSAVAGFLRADYKPFEKLRLIGALRLDKYSLPDKKYLTYQFVATYNLNENNVLRAVYSRANRGPFIVDNHADYIWNLAKDYDLYWNGNQKMNLPVADMLEVGFRTKLFGRVMIDLEGFHNSMKDYSYFSPDSMTLSVDWGQVVAGLASPTNPVIKGYVRYHNFPLTSEQIGLTCNVSVVINKKLNFRVFGTLQQTKLKNFYSRTIWDDFGAMTNSDATNLGIDGAGVAQAIQSGDMTFINSLLSVNGGKRDYTSGNKATTSLVNQNHKSTPAFFGGASVDYTPVPKLTVFSTMYFYSKQTIETNKVDVSNAFGASDMYKVKPKFILDAKVAYAFWKDNRVFINAQNLINNDQKEFAYTDKIGGTYLLGVSLNF